MEICPECPPSVRVGLGSGRKAAQCDQEPSQLNAIRGIDVEHADRGLAAFRSTDQPRSAPAEVPQPLLAPGMKQLDNLPADATCQVGAFAQVAALATPRQI